MSRILSCMYDYASYNYVLYTLLRHTGGDGLQGDGAL